MEFELFRNVKAILLGRLDGKYCRKFVVWSGQVRLAANEGECLLVSAWPFGLSYVFLTTTRRMSAHQIQKFVSCHWINGKLTTASLDRQ